MAGIKTGLERNGAFAISEKMSLNQVSGTLGGKDNTDASSEDVRDADDDDRDSIFLSLFYGQDKIGGAFYDGEDAILYLIKEFENSLASFELVRSVISQVNPGHLCISDNQPEDFMKVVKEACGVRNESDSGDSSTELRLGATIDLQVLPGKTFGYPSCARRLQNQRLSSELDRNSEEEHLVLMNGLVDFNASLTVKSAGALLKFLDGSKITESGNTFIIAIKIFTPKNILRIDNITMTALQIFNPSWQPSGSKIGSWNRSREGLSLFKLLNRCRSVSGSKKLKQMLRSIPRDLATIRERQEAVAFFSHPSQIHNVKAVQGFIGGIKNITGVLKKFSVNQVQVRDWISFQKSVSNMILMGDFCARLEDFGINILRQTSAAVTQNVRSLVEYIDKLFNVEESLNYGQFVVKSGVDEDLDEIRRLHNGLPDFLTSIIERDVQNLPEYMEVCNLIYVPRTGYFVKVQPWCENMEQMPSEEIDKMVPPDMELVFFSNNEPFFKTGRCRSLDRQLGDTATRIVEMQTSIVIKLTNVIVECSEALVEIVHHASILDCLISLALTGVEYGWTRPVMTSSGDLKIIDGRHPLLELCVPTFVPNTTWMGDPIDHPTSLYQKSGKIVIISGPNACGKSVYLKQVGVIVFMAHLGCFIPAESATIPVFDAIYTRIQTIESLELGFSAFMSDINQMSAATLSATSNSLVLIDEFGKGTSQIDGQALLASCLKFWTTPQSCKLNSPPYTLVSTHFKIKPILPHRPEISFKSFSFEQHGDEVIYLYRLVQGTSISSHAENVARKAGLDEDVLDRSREVLRCLTEGEPIGPVPGEEDVVKRKACDAFLALDIDCWDTLAEFFERFNFFNNEVIEIDDNLITSISSST